jgi:hypothetical protein
MPQADDRGPARLEEVFIKELFIFWATTIYRKYDKCEYVKYSASVGNKW